MSRRCGVSQNLLATCLDFNFLYLSQALGLWLVFLQVCLVFLHSCDIGSSLDFLATCLSLKFELSLILGCYDFDVLCIH